MSAVTSSTVAAAGGCWDLRARTPERLRSIGSSCGGGDASGRIACERPRIAGGGIVGAWAAASRSFFAEPSLEPDFDDEMPRWRPGVVIGGGV